MPELDDVIQQLRKRLNLSTVIGYLGDGSGEVHNRTRPGYYYVRFRQANSTFTAPVSLRAHPNANLPDMDGLAVTVGYDPSGDQIILEVFSPGIDAAGINPLTLNPLDSSAAKLRPQSDSLPTFLCTQHADRTNKPLYVVVFPGFIVTSTALVYFPGAELDLTSLVPVAGEHRYVVVCLKSDYATLEAFGSTAKDLDDPLSDDDIEEAYLLRTSGSIAIWAWELRDAQTVLDSDPTKQVDLRTVVGSFSGVTDHGALTGLADDDHTQYALLAGRSGGQVLNGGTASGEDLTLVSTAHATKGSIYFGVAGVLGELTNAGKLILTDSLDVGNVGYTTLTGAGVMNYLGVGVAPSATTPVNIASTLTPTSGSLTGAGVTTTFNPAGASTAANVALLVVGKTQSANAQTFTTLYGVQTQADHYGTNTLTTGAGILSKVTNRSSGTVSNAYGLLTQVYNLGAGAMSNGYGVFIDNPANTGGGTFPASTGLYVDNQGLSGMTTSKGIEIAAQSGATTSHALLVHDSLVTFNEDAASGGIVRMEGASDANLFRTDPDTNSVLLGTATPVSGLKLLVSGAQRITSYLEMTEIAAPSTPASGFGRLYVKTDNTLHFINDGGTDTDLTAGGGGGSFPAAYEDGVSVVAAADTFDFKDANVEDGGGSNAHIYHNLPGIAGGRLTLTTAVPVTTSDVTAATTLYYALYLHDKISLYDGTRWKVYTFTELSISVPATTNQMYDVFLYDNAGTLTLELLAWTNDTTRATALVMQNGVYVKSGATTRRYLGSFRTTGTSGQTEDSKTRRFVWNACNRVRRDLLCFDTSNSWGYSTASWRASDNNTTDGVGRVAIVVGLSEDAIEAFAKGIVSSDSAVHIASGVGIDSTTVNSAQIFGSGADAVGRSLEVIARYTGYLAVGYHYIQHLELGAGSGLQTWRGDNGGSVHQSGMSVIAWS